MSTFKRAWLYVTRKRGKTLLLLIMLTIIAVFVLAVLTVGREAEHSRQRVLETLAGKFIISIGNGKDNPYNVKEQVGEGRYSIINIGPKFTQKNIEEVMSLGAIRSFYACLPTNAYAPELEPVGGALPAEKGLEHFFRGYAVLGSETSDYFLSDTLTLTEGRHIAAGDTDSILISNEFAEKNDLKLGDRISFQIGDTDAELLGIPSGQITQVKIIGIFAKTNTIEMDPGALKHPMDLLENLYFVDIDTHVSMYHEPGDYYQAVFYAENPGEIDQIVDKVRALDTIDWKQFEVAIDNSAYDAAVGPIEGLSSTFRVILLLSIIVSSVILSLVLTMWIKSRIHEAGIFLSIGIEKSSIFFQFLTEAFIITAAAFCLSMVIGKIVITQAGNAIVNFSTYQQTEQDENQEEKDGVTGKGVEIGLHGEQEIDITQPIQMLEIKIQPIDFIKMCLIGTTVVFLSVLIASIPILRLNPRKIFSLMS